MNARWVAHSFAPHMHDFYAVSLNDGGGGAFDCRGEIRYAMPGTSSLIAPGEMHTGHATCGEGWIYRNLYIDTRLMKRLLRGLDWRGPMDVRFKSPLVRDPILASRLARAFASLSDSRSLLENESVLLSVVSRLITHHCMTGSALRIPGQEHAAVLKAKDWIEANSEQNVSIHSLAGPLLSGASISQGSRNSASQVPDHHARPSGKEVSSLRSPDFRSRGSYRVLRSESPEPLL